MNARRPMSFYDATTALMAKLGIREIAAALGCSTAAVTQARLGEDAAGFRAPPVGWEAGLARLARQRSDELARLADRLDALA